MKKTIITLIIIVILVAGGIWWYNANQKPNDIANQESNYQAERSNTNTDVKSNTDTNTNTSTDTNMQNSNPSEVDTQKTETEITSFTTQIYNKDDERQNNIGITCKNLSNTEIVPGETFSFCNTVGRATTAKGYEKADIYVDGEKKQGLGGGNCQVSTTLYNAVIAIPELEVVERHKHSGHVPYIKDGKDAAVAYGSYDFKFKNNTGNTIKIVMENTENNVTARIIKIS